MILPAFWKSWKWSFKAIFCLLLVCFGRLPLQAQDTPEEQSSNLHSVVDYPDTVSFQSKLPDHDPKKATLYSAVLPGLGQAYNHSYWKIPIIYGGFAAFAYLIHFNNTRYQYYLENLSALIDDSANTVNVTEFNEDQLRSLVVGYRRNRDYSMILMGVFYALNVVEAHVDANLKEFEVNDDLALKFTPSFETVMNQPSFGLGIKMRLR